MHRVSFQLSLYYSVESISSTVSKRFYYLLYLPKARFKRRTFHVPNAIQTIDNEIYQRINYCLNCIRHMKSSTFEPGLRH